MGFLDPRIFILLNHFLNLPIMAVNLPRCHYVRSDLLTVLLCVNNGRAFVPVALLMSLLILSRDVM